MATSALFGDDSSSDASSDEEEAAFDMSNAAPADPAPSDEAKPMSQSNDEAEKEEEEEAEKEEVEKEEMAAPDLAVGDPDEEEEEEDVEFDDTEGITGSSRPEPMKQEESGGMTEESPVKYDDGFEREEYHEEKPKVKAPPRHFEVADVPKRQNTTSMHITKLPNFLNVNPDAFEPDSFNAEEEEKEFQGYVHNMIRWRYKKDDADHYMRDDDGELIRESNARFIRWSDGSLTLHVNEEAFEVDQFSTSKDPDSFPGINGYLYLTHKATVDDGALPDKTVLECVAPITSKLTPRPASLRSEAHRNLTLAVRRRNMKKARIAEFNLLIDPEKEKKDRIRNKEDLIKQEGRPSARRSTGVRRRNTSRYYMNEDRGYDSVNISTLKRMNEDLPLDADYAYQDEEDDEEDEWSKKKRMEFKKARKGRRAFEDDDDEDDESEEDEDVMVDESDDEEMLMHSSRKRSRQAVVDEEDDD